MSRYAIRFWMMAIGLALIVQLLQAILPFLAMLAMGVVALIAAVAVMSLIVMIILVIRRWRTSAHAPVLPRVPRDAVAPIMPRVQAEALPARKPPRVVARRIPDKPLLSTTDTLMISIAPAIDQALDRLPTALTMRSGSVFYSGREAFSGPSPLYILGLNPGGDPLAQADETVARDIADFRALTRPWSAYADESWQGAVPGRYGMQPRILHMLAALGLDPRTTPASNVIFPRSRGEADLRAEKAALIRACWPVHKAVLEATGARVVLCLGGTAGQWVREQLGATRAIDSFREANARGWQSTAHEAADGRRVVTVTHPGRADWRNPAADPTPLVARALG